MVAIINHSTSIRRILNYNEQKLQNGKAELILANHFLCDIGMLTKEGKLSRFNHLNEQNKKVKTNTLHVSLNFDPSEKIDIEKLQEISMMYMEGIGFGDQPYLVYQHFDAAHPHLHIISSLVQKDGTRINTHNIGRLKSEPTRKNLEQHFNLVRAEDHLRDVKRVHHPVNVEQAIYGRDETKKVIGRIVTAVTKDYKYTSLAELNAALRRYNIIADNGKEGSYLHAKRGLQYRILDSTGSKIGVPIKASLIHSKPTLFNLEKRFNVNKVLRKRDAEKIRDNILGLWESRKNLSKAQFIKLLDQRNIDVIFRTNDTRRIYGITFVDHETRSVFNGSDLGKAFSANAIMAKLTTDIPRDKKQFFEIEKLNLPLNDGTASRNKFEILNELLASEMQNGDIPYEFSLNKKRKRNRKSRN